MRIGIYDPYLDDLGGGEKYMMSMASCLTDIATVDVFWDNKNDITELLKRFQLDLAKVHLVKNIFTPSTSLLKRLVDTRKYDAIIFLSDGSIPLVVSKKLFLHIQQPLEKSQVESLLGKFKLSRASSIFCNSMYTKNFVDRRLGVHSLVVYPPVSLHAKKVKKENIILHVGRFRVKNVNLGDYKKQSVMVDAFKQMVKNGLKGWKFVLAVGVMEQDTKEFKKMQESAEGFPIAFEVNKSNQELWDLYSKAKIYWHASGYGEDLDAHPDFAEHFGISTVEAMGAGAVPVVINAGGQKEIVTNGENGYLWNSLEELQEKTLDLTKDKKQLERLSRSAAERAKDFSYESFSQTVHEMIIK